MTSSDLSGRYRNLDLISFRPKSTRQEFGALPGRRSDEQSKSAQIASINRLRGNLCVMALAASKKYEDLARSSLGLVSHNNREVQQPVAVKISLSIVGLIGGLRLPSTAASPSQFVDIVPTVAIVLCRQTIARMGFHPAGKVLSVRFTKTKARSAVPRPERYKCD